MSREKDEREWTLSNRAFGIDTLASYITEGPELAEDETVEVVPKAKLAAAEAERDAHRAKVEHWMERAERAEAALAEAEEARSDWEVEAVRAGNALDRALDLLERARPACEVQHWSGAGEHPLLGPLSREMQTFLEAHGRR